MTLPPALSTTPLENPAMDYAFLRREGFRLLEKLNGGQWTDFNAHDPGITILEQVCYAITDLAYRINYDIEDLLASGEDHPYHSIYSPAEVLTINPVTLADLRKLVIDVPGVKNAWIEQVEKPESEPAMVYDPSDEGIYLETSTAQPAQREPILPRGIYRVLIETDATSKLDATGILKKVNDRLHACRSLGEDFIYPEILPGEPILVNAEIEISAVEDPERLLTKIYLALAGFISPRIHFYTLAEMLQKGKRMDEIMNGPVLQHGFIEDDDLEKLERKTSIRTSDLIQEIMNVEGVLAVNTISIASGNETEDWYLTLDALRAPFLNIETSLFPLAPAPPAIRLIRRGVEVLPNPTRVGNIIKDLQTTASDKPLPESQRDFRVPPGRDRRIGQYYSIQNQFPATYGIGALGLPESASRQRKAQAKQLKAYLLFFDQLLANTFAQLANANKLFAFNPQETRTYFSQAVEEAGLGLDEIRINDIGSHTTNLQTITENPESALARRNRLLNHLLARFAEQFTDYALPQYAKLGEKELEELMEDLIKAKSSFLQDYKEIGASRGTGFDYTQPSRDTGNISGLEKRIRRKLGIANNDKRDLAGMDEESEGGFHLLEHILLRPREADGGQFKQSNSGTNWQAGALLAGSDRKDPYSHQISFVFPNWVKRFQKPGSTEPSEWIGKTLREEAPAHLRIYIHWLGKDEMSAFESAQKDWLENVIAGRMWNPSSVNPADDPGWLIHIKLRDARDRMIQALGIGLPYPLRDLKLEYHSIVTFDQPTSIQIIGAQIGVLYQLCDEDGNPIPPDENGNRFEVQPEAGKADEKVFLPTPKIQKDITFTILAVREGNNRNIRLEVYLNEAISIQSGIDDNLCVAFQPAEGQIATTFIEIIINYGDKVTVKIFGSQEGISYKLVTSPGIKPDLSDHQKGNTGEISLISTDGFMEDIPFNILAYRTANWHDSKVLKTNLSVKVRPNPSVGINLQPVIIDYGAESTLSLTGHQATAEYKLYKRELISDEYLSNAITGNIQIHTDEGLDVFIKAPEKITVWVSANDFVLVDEFKDNAGALSAGTGSLLEDTLFIVSATKFVNGESLQLDQAVVVLVRPDTAPIVSVLDSVVPTGTAGMVTIENTQKGVAYQLRLDVDNERVNPLGYHLTDRGINTTRLEVDFIVEDQGEPVLLLPTGNLTAATTFNVLASKIITGVSAELTGKANLEVS